MSPPRASRSTAACSARCCCGEDQNARFLRGHYQNAYVTHDRKWAMDNVGQRYGLENWITFEVELRVTTPGGERTQATKVACVWDGALQLELIEPVSGFIDPF